MAQYAAEAELQAGDEMPIGGILKHLGVPEMPVCPIEDAAYEVKSVGQWPCCLHHGDLLTEAGWQPPVTEPAQAPAPTNKQQP